MPKIKLLDKNVYEKIAAGECIEKPASIIKELVENSFDAEATEIIIEIENGGIDSIVVKDNGVGIQKEDLINAFIPHATSKISSADDLYNLSTMGFRGEALSSIAAVSNVELLSKTKEQDSAFKVIVNGGEIGKITECASSNGTYISVKNLFYNIPARAKFLRKPKQEEKDITNYIEKLMLSKSNISFKYVVDGKIIYNTIGSELLDNIYTIYGDIINNLLPINYERDGYKIIGYISKPDFCKNNRTYQTLFVNGRFVQNFMIGAAIQNAYNDFLMKGKFPFFVLNLIMPPNSLDVNVHPSKLEIKFENSNFIYGLFNSAVYEILYDDAHKISPAKIEMRNDEVNENINVNNSINELNRISNENNNEKQKDYFSEIYEKQDSKTLNFFTNNNKNNNEFIFKDSGSNILNSEILLAVQNELKNDESLNENISNQPIEFQKQNIHELIDNQEEIDQLKDSYKIIGVIFETYIIIEKKDKIYIIDQHASHERLLYDKIMKEVESNKVTSQSLLVPYVLNLSTKESMFILDNIDYFNSFGFNIVPFGDNSFKVEQVPYIIQNIDLKKYFDNILEDSDKLVRKPMDYMREYFTQRACKAAVKAGMKLSDLEIKTIFDLLNEDDNVLLCPHGRPILFSLSKKDIEKMFKRIV